MAEWLAGAVVEDIISQGDDRPPAHWRRRAVIALVAVLAVVLVVVNHLPHGHPAAAPKPPLPPPARPFPRPAPVSVHDGGPGGRRSAGTLGLTARWSRTARVPRAGHHPAWYWPGRGTAEPIRGLPYERAGYLFTRLGGGWAVTGESGGAPSCENCPAFPPPAVYYLADHSRSAARVGEATTVAPGAEVAGQPTMWLTTFPAGARFGTVAGTTREYTASGRELSGPVVLPVGYSVVQGTQLGLLLVSITRISAASTYQLWNPAGGKLLRTFDGVIATSARQVAFLTECGFTCPVHVVDLKTGRQTSIKVSYGYAVTGGVFSPDGRYLALAVSFGDGDDGSGLGDQLEVASMATSRLRVVPHTLVGSDILTGFGWAVHGDGLVAEFSFSTSSQMTLWMPRMAALAVASVRHDQRPTELVVG